MEDLLSLLFDVSQNNNINNISNLKRKQNKKELMFMLKSPNPRFKNIIHLMIFLLKFLHAKKKLKI